MKWNDKARANSEERNHNEKTLRAAGFENSGLYSCSGLFYIEPRKYGAVAVFGLRSNIGGRGFNKYFSIAKRYDSVEAAEKEAAELMEKMEQRNRVKIDANGYAYFESVEQMLSFFVTEEYTQTKDELRWTHRTDEVMASKYDDATMAEWRRLADEYGKIWAKDNGDWGFCPFA